MNIATTQLETVKVHDYISNNNFINIGISASSKAHHLKWNVEREQKKCLIEMLI